MTERALVVAGHGSHRNPDSAAPVRETISRIREQGAFSEVCPAFWKEEPSLREVLHTVDADEAVVVPLFVSEGYFVEQVLPREFELGERDRNRDNDQDGDDSLTVSYADPIGTHPAMTDVIAARARRLLDGPADDVALAVVGHGTERNPNSADAIYDHVEALRDRGTFAEVGALFMDEAPYVEDVRDRFDAAEIAVVPLFISDGFHTRDEIPELLGLTDDAASGYPVPATVGDRRIWYTSAVGTDPLVADVVLERAAEAGANVGESAEAEASAGRSRPVRSDAAAAFLDWVENAPEVSDTDASGAVTDTSVARQWGELAVTPEGDEHYDLRHRADRETAVANLAVREVGDLREAVRYADDGRYRPFSGEQTLPRGWVLTDLDRDALLRAVGIVYPTSVEHWAEERSGDLNPVDFRAVADRQTGIYECVSDCSREEVARTVEACCGNCAKRRTWDAGDGEFSHTASDGAIPCREPCSFLVAAAREFHQHESSDEPTDEQPREEDASVPRGDLTDPANVYRVRYRRTGRREITPHS